MLDRIIRSTQLSIGHLNTKSTTFRAFARTSLSRFITTAHHALLITGAAALCTLALMLYRPDLAQQIKAMSIFLTPANERAPALSLAVGDVPLDMPRAINSPRAAAMQRDVTMSTGRASLPTAQSDRQQQWVTNWLSKRYRVAADATNMLVSAAYTTSNDIKIDPLLILAVVAIESGFNPFAESAVGAQGLMQVMSNIHREKFQKLGGVKAALNPVANIRVGSLILKDYVTRGGSLEAGLKMYVGAAAFDNDAGYGSKVLAEYRRLKDVASGKNVPVFSTPSMARLQPKTPSAEAPSTAVKETTAVIDKPMQPEAHQNATPSDQLAAM